MREAFRALFYVQMGIYKLGDTLLYPNLNYSVVEATGMKTGVPPYSQTMKPTHRGKQKKAIFTRKNPRQ